MVRMPRQTEIALALDVPDRHAADPILDQVAGEVDWIKVGLQLFCREGPDWVRTLVGHGFRVFLDLKLHDIPNTVAKAVESVASTGAHLLTLHAAGGKAMLERAVESRDATLADLRLVAVTVLTSMDETDLAETGIDAAPGDQVLRLASLALRAGVDGLVSSPLELHDLRVRFGDLPFLVTPGIRPIESDANEQKRTLSPADAAIAGSDLLVIGRPILKAADPAAAARAIRESLAAAVSTK